MENKIAFFIDGGYFTCRVEFFLRKYFISQLLNTQPFPPPSWWVE